MDCSTSGFPVLHHLLEFGQTHVHWVGDAIQPSHPLSSLNPMTDILVRWENSIPQRKERWRGWWWRQRLRWCGRTPRNTYCWQPAGVRRMPGRKSSEAGWLCPNFRLLASETMRENTSIVSSPLPYDQLLWQTQKSNKLPLRKRNKRFLRVGGCCDIPTLSLDRGKGRPACPFMRWHLGRDTGRSLGAHFQQLDFGKIGGSHLVPQFLCFTKWSPWVNMS